MVVEIAFALLAVVAGATIQSSVGFGFSLVAVPTMAFLRPEAVPVTLLLLALPMTSYMALKERHSIVMGAFAWITGGRVIGTILGIGFLEVVSQGGLGRLLGFLVLAASIMSFVGPSFEARNTTQLAGGVASGVMSTAAALGGPPLALVNQKSSGPELRSTLALSFVVGLLLSLTALALAGRVEPQHAVLALKLLPGLLLGLYLGGRIAGQLDERWLRPAILMFAAAGGVAVLLLGPQT